MFPARYFNPRSFARRYFAKLGAVLVPAVPDRLVIPLEITSRTVIARARVSRKVIAGPIVNRLEVNSER
jgi:hypothetical protein